MSDAVEVVRLRNNFYRDNYRRVVSILLLSVVINIGLIGIIFYKITHQPPPQYFATTSTGSLIPLVPLERPNQANSTIVQWANEAAVSAYTFNFVDYRKRLQESSDYFTPAGWKQFLAGLDESNNLQAITRRKLIMQAVSTGAPVIEQQGVINGQYSWKVSMPLLVSLQSANQLIQQSLTITMLVTRVSPLDNPKGIAIAQFIARQRT